MCDPFGRSDPDSVKNYGDDDVCEHNYIFFFDQEPIHLDIHTSTFDEVHDVRNLDLHYCYQNIGAICTSERDSDTVDLVLTNTTGKAITIFFTVGQHWIGIEDMTRRF
jgi:hypothetical protein